MHRIDTSTAQKDKFGAGKNGFTLGNAQTGVPPTEVSADILDAIQEEICSVIESEGLQLDKSKRDQLLYAINKKISSVPSATIEKKGVVRLATDEEARLGQSIEAVMSAKNVADAVKDMLKQMFVGIILKWPTEVPPDWALSVMGQAINATTDPLLAKRYPTLRLPDARAEFFRGWDNGRGVDAGRKLLSWMPDSLKSHSHTLTGWGRSSFDITGGPLFGGMDTPSPGTGETLDFPASGGGPETAPRSLAVHYITMRG